jgi:undecaprenyl-diphosphatase
MNMFNRKEYPALGVLAFLALVSYMTGFDYFLAKSLSNRASHGVSLFFSEWYFLAYMLGAFLILLKKNRKAAIALVVSVALVFLVQAIITDIAPRQRPPEAMPIGDGLMKIIRGFGASSSFPSGHTASTVAVFTMFLLIGFHPMVVLFLGIPIMVSRITLVQHYLSDVLGGIVIGYVIAILAFRLIVCLSNNLYPRSLEM